ncbi:hypothetical protein VNI00_010844 [Paramarasmius palmivorus]|uniref:Glycoside hydrolase family 76 protein n=1 Tax=Paramarasmius palmivorus TaxID=297713 RepID=A0AAW0CF54_9AGAR
MLAVFNSAFLIINIHINHVTSILLSQNTTFTLAHSSISGLDEPRTVLKARGILTAPKYTSTPNFDRMTIALRMLILVIVLLLDYGVAQSLVPPSTWQNSTITIPMASRVSLAASAIDVSIQQLDYNLTYCSITGPYCLQSSITLHLELCLFDLFTNQTTYEDHVGRFFNLRGEVGTGNLPSEESPNDIVEIVDISIQYGYAAFHAYLAYKNDTFLQLAEGAWNRANMFVVSGDQNTDILRPLYGANQRFPGAEFGGSLVTTGLDAVNLTYIYATLSGRFIALSALLAGETSNTTYANTAKSTTNFVKAKLFSGRSPGNPQSTRVTNNCTLSFDEPSAEGTAWWIDGISSMIATDNWEAQDAMNLLQQAILGSTKQNWVNVFGILSDTQLRGDRGSLVNAFVQSYGRIIKSDDLRSYISTFVSVQYNAVLNNARSPDIEIYKEWTPSAGSATFIPWNQITAIFALLAGTVLPDHVNVAASPTGPASVETAITGGSQHSYRGAIIGGAVGGCITLAMFILLAVACHRRISKSGDDISPFVMEAANPRPQGKNQLWNEDEMPPNYEFVVNSR